MYSTRALLLSAAALLGPLSLASTSYAQPAAQTSDEANRTEARRLALEGVAAQGRADWPTVIDRFERAEQLFHAPVHLRFLAIAYERSTPPRMVLAAETWQLLSQEQLDSNAPQPFRDAVAEAQRELARFDTRLGHLVIEVPTDVQGAAVTVNGEAYASSRYNTPRFVEAGELHIAATVPGRQPFERTVTLAPGATERVQIAPPPLPQVVEAPPPPQPRTVTVMRSNPLRTVGIITASVGGAVLIGGVVSGLMASSEFDTLQSECPMNRCPTAQALSRRDSVDSLATTSTALYVTGGLLVAAGVALFFIGAPREETVTVSVGPRSAGLTLRF
jgi:hypothetical protein